MGLDLGSELFRLVSELFSGWKDLPIFEVQNAFGSVKNFQTLLIYLAPALQISGYVAYILYIMNGKITPNPWSWAMFAYGTSLLTFLEWKLGAPVSVLLLPIVCSGLSIILFFWTIFLPESEFSFWDLGAFMADVSITAAYWLSAERLASGELTVSEHDFNTMLFLIGANLTTLTAFSPLIREGLAKAGHEVPLPWLIWTLAYASLGLLTFMQVGLFSVLMIYPLLSSALHLAVGIFSMVTQDKKLTAK